MRITIKYVFIVSVLQFNLFRPNKTDCFAEKKLQILSVIKDGLESCCAKKQYYILVKD